MFKHGSLPFDLGNMGGQVAHVHIVAETPEARLRSAQRVVQAKEQGYSPVVVVSAIGRKGQPYATDTLIGLPSDRRASRPRWPHRAGDSALFRGVPVRGSAPGGLPWEL